MNSANAAWGPGRDEKAEMPLGRGKDGNQRFRDDDVSDADSDSHNLREGADVEDGRLRIDSCERGNGTSLEVEVTVVVVLDDRRSRVLGKLQQCEPATDRHERSSRILMRGRHEDDPRRLVGVESEAMPVQRYANDIRSRRTERGHRAPIPRTLDPGHVVGFHDDLRD